MLIVVISRRAVRFAALVSLVVGLTTGCGNGDEVSLLGPEDHPPGQVDQWIAHRGHLEVNQGEDAWGKRLAVHGVVDLVVTVHHGEIAGGRAAAGRWQGGGRDDVELCLLREPHNRKFPAKFSTGGRRRTRPRHPGVPDR